MRSLKLYRNSTLFILLLLLFSFQERGQYTGSPANVTQASQYKGMIGTYWLFTVCIRHFKNKKKTWPT